MEIFLFQMENKLQIAVFYHVMIKKAVMLDNFCKGLEVLGVLEKIKKNPSQFESVFIHNEEELTTSAVLAEVLYQPEVPKLKCRFEAFIQDLSKPGNYSYNYYYINKSFLCCTNPYVPLSHSKYNFV